jgi:deaminated glutathione amidase
MRPFAVAGLQIDVRAKENQVDEIETKIDRLILHFPWVEMVVLSELAVGTQVHADAEPMPGPTEAALARIGAKHGVWFIPGSLYEADGGKIYNTTPVIDPTGTVIGRHRKLFPFTPYEAGIAAGSEPFVFDVPNVGRFGVLICYDMWFPETSRWLITQGVEVILRPALTDTIDREIELAMVRATAAQNQCFVLDVNGLGDGGVGGSLFVGPAGEVLHQAGSSPEEIPFEIDLDRVTRGREVGLRGLGQPLKSFRDRAFEFDFYAEGAKSDYLNSLGPLEKTQRGSRAGLGDTPSKPRLFGNTNK